MAEIPCPLSQRSHQIAVSTPTRAYTYHELNSAITHLMRQLEKANITEGSRVAFVAQTTLPAILLFFALFRLRAIACPLSFRHPQLPPLLEQLSATHFLDLDQLVINTSPNHTDATLELDQLATCLFTSGTSGPPKIACHTLGNHIFSALGAIPALQLKSHSRWLLALPLFHVSGISILFRCFLVGATVVLAQDLTAITHVSFVPTQLFRLLQEPEKIPPTLTCAFIGGAALSPTLHAHALQHKIPIFLSYGMTEMASVVVLEDPEMQHILPYRQLKLADDGEILVRGETLFAGYWQENQLIRNLHAG